MHISLNFGNIVFAIIGFSTSFLLCVPELKRWKKKQIAAEKLRIISEVLEAAEERVARYQERHDRILSQISGCYLINEEVVEALAGARATMNQALEMAFQLKRIQLKIICSFPEALDLLLSEAFNNNTITLRNR